MTEWGDDAESFYERSIGDIVNGGGDAQSAGGLRPSALYLATNVPDTEAATPDPAVDRGGYLDVQYGEAGNVEAFTVRAQCHDASAAVGCFLERDLDPTSATRGQPLGTLAQQKQRLADRCVCAEAQHYEYRWDELNRLAEARRYDQSAPGASPTWELAVRQRYRYDAGNVRVLKQTLGEDELGAPFDRIHLYVSPGEFERSGVAVNYATLRYDGDPSLGTETQYTLGGARIVWKPGTNPTTFDRQHRITMAVKDLIQSTAAVTDLDSGELLELSTYYPNGARETHRTTHKASYQLELNGFTGKEEDEEVGLVYFGERYLIPRVGRWASADPLAIHAVGGGEVLNSYHYVSGNLLQGRDPMGLEDPDEAMMSMPASYCTADSSCEENGGQSDDPGTDHARASGETRRSSRGTDPPERPAAEVTTEPMTPAGSDAPIRSIEVPDGGAMDYYYIRHDDFVRRNPGQEPPDYYLEYGEKYLQIFSQETAPDLSPMGRRWLEDTREALQVKTEEQLLEDPAGFAAMERDGEALREFEFDIHPDAYIESGLADLPRGDLWEIGWTPEAEDILTPDGIEQTFETAGRVINIWWNRDP